VNCFVFSHQNDLVDKIDQVLAMDPDTIEEMKSRVIEYYEQHLDPKSFIDRLTAIEGNNIMLLMITDGCVARNPTGLNKHSILITGVARHAADIWKDFRSSLGI